MWGRGAVREELEEKMSSDNSGRGGWHLVIGVDDVGVDVAAGTVGKSLTPALLGSKV